MPKSIKWVLIGIGALIIVFFAIVIVAIMMIDMDKLKPTIEAQATKALNRPVTLGGELSPSIFPWAGIALSDVHLGNPPGFSEKDFVSVGQFEVRVKLLPLFSGKYQIKRFVIKDTRIIIEKNKKGISNLDGLGKTAETKAPAETQPAKPKTGKAESELPVKSLKADEFAITNAQLIIIDATTASRKEIKDFNLLLTDFSLDKPIGLQLSALADNKAINLSGTVGPVGPEPGKSSISFDVVTELLKQLKVQIKGRVDTPVDSPQMALQIQIPDCSPRKILAALNQQLPFEPSDPAVLNKFGLSLNVDGTTEQVSVSNGKLTLDDTRMTFQAQAKAFDKPDLKLKVQVDQIDVDRYLPLPAEKPADTPESQSPPDQTKQKTDYAPLRKLLLDAQFAVGNLKVKKGSMQNITVTVTAKNGIIKIDPLNINLYQGKFATTGTLDVRKDQPVGKFNLKVNGVQAGPLVKDFMNKDIIQGMAVAGIDLQFTGDQPQAIRQSLDGKGEILFQDGAIVGIDLAGMVRNVQSAFGLAEKTTEKPRTDFSELLVAFSVADGIAKLNDSKLNSPLMRLLASGTADIVKERLDIRVEPKFVATIKGQGDTENRSGFMVPVNIKGKFTDLRYEPDLKSILKQQLTDEKALENIIPDKKEIEKIVPREEEVKKELEKKAQDLFKDLPFGKPRKE